jgi:hypothetical protein
MISTLEVSLDGRSSFFRGQSEHLYQKLDKNSDGKVSFDEFMKCVPNDPGCRPIIDFILAIDSASPETARDMRMLDFIDEGEFSDVHSDISAADSVTPAIDDEIPELSNRLSLLESDVKELDEEDYFSNHSDLDRDMNSLGAHALGEIMEDTEEEAEEQLKYEHLDSIAHT